MRVGIGYDIHRLVEGRTLILGGIKIPFKKGLLGDSDADVLTHAIIDALLGAAGLGDIGRVFGVGKEELMGISSILLFERSLAMAKERKLLVINCDATILAEAPILSPYIPQMVEKIAKILNIPRGFINIKATTNQGLGEIGRKEAIAAYAILLARDQDAQAL